MQGHTRFLGVIVSESGGTPTFVGPYGTRNDAAAAVRAQLGEKQVGMVGIFESVEPAVAQAPAPEPESAPEAPPTPEPNA